MAKKWTKNASDYGIKGCYISKYYGTDIGTPDYDSDIAIPDENLLGGKNNPLKSTEKASQSGYITYILDSAQYNISTLPFILNASFIVDGVGILDYRSDILNTFNLFDAMTYGYRNVNRGVKTENCIVISSYMYSLQKKSILVDCGFPSKSIPLTNCITQAHKGAVYDVKNSIVILQTTGSFQENSALYYSDYNIIIGSIKYGSITYSTLDEVKNLGVMLKSFDMGDLGLRTNLLEDDSHADNLNDWKKLFNHPIDVDIQNYMYADFSISPLLHQRIYDNQITNHGKTPAEATAIATSGVQKVMYGGQYGGYIGAKPMATRIDADALWNTYKFSSTNLEYTSGNLITTDNTQVGTYESLEIPFGKKIVVENGSLANEVAYQLRGWVDARVSADDYETIDNTVEQRTVMVYELNFYQDPNEDNTGAWTGYKRFEVNAPLRIDNAGNGNQDVGYDDTQAQVIHDVTKFKLRFEMRKVACGSHPDKPCV